MKVTKTKHGYSITFENFISDFDLQIAYLAYKKEGGKLSKEEYLKDQFLQYIKL